MAVNLVTNSNSKHIYVRHHFLQEHVDNGEFEISHVESKYQHADFLTKPLAKDAFRFHRNFIINMSRFLLRVSLVLRIFLRLGNSGF